MHSRNKAQEIQGAIEPLALTYRNSAPFKGAILAGVFTAGALNQLRSLGFTVLYFPYESVVGVFKKFGIAAHFDESTPDLEFQQKVDGCEELTAAQKAQLAKALWRRHKSEVATFLESLAKAVSRQIDRIVIMALHGRQQESLTIEDAIRFVEMYADEGDFKPIDRYEIEVRYNNGDLIRGSFKDKLGALEFLRAYQPPLPCPVKN